MIEWIKIRGRWYAEEKTFGEIKDTKMTSCEHESHYYIMRIGGTWICSICNTIVEDKK